MERKQQWFVDETDHDVGRPFIEIPVPKPSVKITPIYKPEYDVASCYDDCIFKCLYIKELTL